MSRIGLVVVLAVVWCGAVWGQEIVLEADSWMPYNGDGGKETGYMIDLAKAVFEPQGLTVKFVPVPWARALQDVDKGACDGVVGAGLEDDAKLVYPKVAQGMSAQAFYTTKDKAWRYDGVPSLAAVKLAVIKDYSYTPEIDDYVKTAGNKVFVQKGDDALLTNLRMLVAGRHDVVVDDANVLRYVIRTNNLGDRVRMAGKTAPSAVYIAFSPAKATGSEYAKALSVGTEKLRQSGALAKILAKYGLEDWQ